MKINIYKLAYNLYLDSDLYINKYTSELIDEYEYEKKITNKEDYIFVDKINYEQYLLICKKFYNTIKTKEYDKIFQRYLHDFKEYSSALHNFVIDYNLEKQWDDFEDNELIVRAKKICEKNNIEYYFDKEELRNFDLDKIAQDFLKDKDRIAYYNKKYNLE